MRTIVIIMTIMFLTSCHDAEMDKRIGMYLCRDHGGLYEIKPLALGGLRIRCNDNTTHNPRGVIIPAGELIL